MAPAVETEEKACLISKEVAHVLAVLAMRNNPMREDSLKVRECLERWVRWTGGEGRDGEEGELCAVLMRYRFWLGAQGFDCRGEAWDKLDVRNGRLS